MDDIGDIFKETLREMHFFDSPRYFMCTFQSLGENYSKVNFLEDLLKKYNHFEKILKKFKLREEKCNVKSLALRKLGNVHFSMKKNHNYIQALALWNESICYSEPGSENLSICYANRSAVLFKWKRYRECLVNIDLARKANYPLRSMDKLNKREEDCRQRLATQLPDLKLFKFKLTYKRHALVPYIADCLELKQTKTEGRFIITNRDLCVGDTIAAENPFCSVLSPQMRYQRCATCTAENYLTLIPCESCCSAMFCSNDCREKALATFHKFECPIIDFIHRLAPQLYDLALRISLTALDAFGNIENLMEFCGDAQNLNRSAMDVDYTNFTQREYYRAIHGLKTNQQLRSKRDLFVVTMWCATLKHFLMHSTPLKNFLGGQKQENFFTELLFQHFQTATTNSHGSQILQKDGNIYSFPIVSSNIFAFLSLLNHSCAPNAVLSFKGSKAYLNVVRPIKTGGGIHVCYGNNFLHHTKEERNHELSRQYFFTCKCDACENDYPTNEKLLVKPFLKFVSSTDERLINNYDFALANYRKYCNFLMATANAYPCQQISDAEFWLFYAFHMLSDAVALKVKID